MEHWKDQSFDCTRCPTCYSLRPGANPREHNFVPPSGPRTARVMWIGEGPGGTENETLRPFSGASGKEQTETYARLGGLDRDECFVTNVVKCRPPANKTPSEKEAAACASMHLRQEVRQVNPDIIVALGATACKLFGVSVDLEHGMPRMARLWGWEGVLWPMYHPASGMHDTSKMAPLLEDWERYEEWMEGRWEPPTDQYPKTDYGVVRTAGELNSYLTRYAVEGEPGGCNPYKFVGMDTERHGGQMWSVQVSVAPGTARWIYARTEGELRVLKALWAAVELGGWTVVLHNAPQDEDWMERVGMPVEWHTEVLRTGRVMVRDTMARAYHRSEPQGLKVQGFRKFGVRMQGYEDVVRPHSVRAMMRWMADAVAVTMGYATVVREEGKKRKCGVCGKGHLKKEVGAQCGDTGKGKGGKMGKGCGGTVQVVWKEKVTPHPLQKHLERILGHTTAEGEYDPWEKIEEVRGKGDGSAELLAVVEMEGEVGGMPIEGIAHVPEREAVEYGCRDADITLRLVLQQEGEVGERYVIQERDVVEPGAGG